MKINPFLFSGFLLFLLVTSIRSFNVNIENEILRDKVRACVARVVIDTGVKWQAEPPETDSVYFMIGYNYSNKSNTVSGYGNIRWNDAELPSESKIIKRLRRKYKDGFHYNVIITGIFQFKNSDEAYRFFDVKN